MISVIVPVYNAGEKISLLLACLCEQQEKNFEVLLINDGSTDNSGMICGEIAKKDSRFRCYHQKNAGVSAARNRGIKEAKGQYVTFLDADDSIEINYLAVLLETIEKSGADMAVCDVAVIRNGKEERRFTCADSLWGRVEALNHLLERKDMNSGPCAKLFKREIIENVTFPPLKVYEDILFIKSAICNCRTVAVTNRTTYFYVQNDLGAMSSFSSMPTEDIIVATDDLLHFIQLDKRLSPESFYTTASHLMQYVLPLLKNKIQNSQIFVLKSRTIYKKYFWSVMRCKAFPYKEKLAYGLFALGWDVWNRKRV